MNINIEYNADITVWLCPGYGSSQNGTIAINLASPFWKSVPIDELPDTVVEIVCHEEIELLAAIETLQPSAHPIAVKAMAYVGKNTTSLVRFLAESGILNRIAQGVWLRSSCGEQKS